MMENYELISKDNNGIEVIGVTTPEATAGHIYEITDGDEALLEINFQNGSFAENSINGITSEALLDILIHRTGELNKMFSSPENQVVIGHLMAAKGMLELRRNLRTTRGVNDQAKA